MGDDADFGRDDKRFDAAVGETPNKDASALDNTSVDEMVAIQRPSDDNIIGFITKGQEKKLDNLTQGGMEGVLVNFTN